MYRAEQEPETGVWVVSHDGRDLPAMNFHDDDQAARDMATALNWAEEDRKRHHPPTHAED